MNAHTTTRRLSGCGRRTRVRSSTLTAALAAAAIAAVLSILGAFGIGNARAEQSLVTSNPSNGVVVDRRISTIALTFAEPVGATNTVTASCGDTPVALEPPIVGPDGVTVSADLVDNFPNGTCVVAYSVVDAAGNITLSNTISFTVNIEAADTTGTDTTAPADTTPDTLPPSETRPPQQVTVGQGVTGPLALGRLLAAIGLAILFGGIVLIVLSWTDGVDYIDARKLLRVGWIVAVVGTTLQCAGMAAQASGASSAFSTLLPTNWGDLTDSTPGLGALARFFFTLLAGWVAQRPDRVVDPATRLAAVSLPGIAVATFGLSRDTGGGAGQLLGYVAGTVHGLSMAVWLGGIIMLAVVVLNGEGDEDLVFAVQGFGRIANLAIIATVISGGVQLARLDGGDLFGSAHGGLILVKTLVVVAMVFIGTAVRQFAMQKLHDAEYLPGQLARRLQRTVKIEAGLGLATVLFTSWAMSFTPPKVEANAVVGEVGAAVVIENVDYTVTVAITQKVGPNALEVTIERAEPPIENLVVTFEPPPGSTAFAVTQPIPLSGPADTVTGQTARLAKANGLPLSASGNWQVIVTIGNIEIGRATINIAE